MVIRIVLCGFVFGCIGCSRENTSVANSQSAKIAEYDRIYDEQLKRGGELLLANEEQSERFEILLAKWENQADRQDELLDQWTKITSKLLKLVESMESR
jgi:hypothetical protein